MSIWQFNAAIKGYIAANSSKEKTSFQSLEEMDRVFAFATQEEKKPILTTNNVYSWDGINFELVRVVNFETMEVKKAELKPPKEKISIREQLTLY